MKKPAYRTIVRFRTRFFDEPVPLFEQIVRICQGLGLGGLNHTLPLTRGKIKANASLKKTKSAKQLEKRSNLSYRGLKKARIRASFMRQSIIREYYTETFDRKGQLPQTNPFFI